MFCVGYTMGQVYHDSDKEKIEQNLQKIVNKMKKIILQLTKKLGKFTNGTKKLRFARSSIIFEKDSNFDI